MTILSGSLQSNRTYQFMVEMENRRNSSQQATGYVLVKVEDTRRQLIAIGCVITTMCSPNLEYQLVNPTTQVALFSISIDNFSIIKNITWNIYTDERNSSANYSQWTLFNRTDNWFFGKNTSNFTATNQLFLSNPQIKFWKFEVVYSFLTETSTSALSFVINQPPYNGSCSISPQNGTTSTLFTILCSDWFDEDGIKDYTFYAWTATDVSHKTIIAFSSMSVLQVRLPTGDDQTSTLHLIVEIRDELNCIVEYNLSSVIVLPDEAAINDLISNLQGSSIQIANNAIVQLLASGDQNTVGQVITSMSQQFNKINTQTINKAVLSGIPVASISVSPLGSQRLSSVGQFNQSTLIEFNKNLNSQANVREFLMSFTTDLAITTSNSIKLQSSALAQLTKSTNQLTRTTLTIASNKCYQLSVALESLSTRIAYEDIQIAATQLIQCASNVLSAVNGPLQERMNILDVDARRASVFPDDYDTDLESEWSKINSMDDKNLYYQKQLANQIKNQMDGIISKLTATLNVHLNIGQQTIMNTPEVYTSFEKQSIESLSNKQIKQVAGAVIRLPSGFQTNFSLNTKVSIRVSSSHFFLISNLMICSI